MSDFCICGHTADEHRQLGEMGGGMASNRQTGEAVFVCSRFETEEDEDFTPPALRNFSRYVSGCHDHTIRPPGSLCEEDGCQNLADAYYAGAYVEHWCCTEHYNALRGHSDGS